MHDENTAIDLSVNIAGLQWNNPITTASGTFSLRDSEAFYDPSLLGALTTKGVSLEPWDGNPSPRIAETYGGMLNAIGLENPGVQRFRSEELPLLISAGPPIIVNLAGRTVEEYAMVAEMLDETEIDMMEVNISCPNIKEGGIAFGTDPAMAAAVTAEVKRRTSKPVFVKLSPNVTDITEIAKAVEAAGADGISMINTLLGMQIDLARRRPALANRMGGLSGPAIKPVAIRMVYQVRRAVALPIIGMGGVMTGLDAAEFLLAGADGVAVGTGALADPTAPIRILHELEDYLLEQKFKTIAQWKNAFQEDDHGSL
jgi:dihydroorotate dehydrogenase (NAD+) catalytic subunit